jgi:hypothetical protein
MVAVAATEEQYLQWKVRVLREFHTGRFRGLNQRNSGAIY